MRYKNMSETQKKPAREQIILDEIIKILANHGLTLQEGWDLLTYHAGGYFLARFITPRETPIKEKIRNLLIADCI